VDIIISVHNVQLGIHYTTRCYRKQLGSEQLLMCDLDDRQQRSRDAHNVDIMYVLSNESTVKCCQLSTVKIQHSHCEYWQTAEFTNQRTPVNQ